MPIQKIAYIIIICLCLTACQKWKKQPEPEYHFPDEPDVAVFENHINYSTNNWITKTYKYKNYISKNYGVIKRIDIDSNKVWVLKRYNVIQ